MHSLLYQLPLYTSEVYSGIQFNINLEDFLEAMDHWTDRQTDLQQRNSIIQVKSKSVGAGDVVWQVLSFFLATYRLGP